MYTLFARRILSSTFTRMGLLNIFSKPAHGETIPVKYLTYSGKDTKPGFTHRNQGLPVQHNMLLIKVLTAGLNPLDLQLMNFGVLSSVTFGEKGIGRDFCGVIEQVGTNHLNKWKVGDKVCGMFMHLTGLGTVSSHIVLDPSVDCIVKVPTNLSDEEAAAFPLSLGTAIKCLNHVKLDSSSWICVLGGATAVGQFTIQLAKNVYNVEKVVVTCSQASSQFCIDLGADATIDYKTTESIPDALLDILEQRNNSRSETSPDENPQKNQRFKLIFDCAGGTEVVNRAAELLEPVSKGSAYVTVVGDHKTNPKKLGGPGAYTRHPCMIGRSLMSAVGVSGINYIVDSISPGDWIEKAYQYMLEGKAHVLIDSTYDWNDWEKALECLANPKHRGKVVLKISN